MHFKMGYFGYCEVYTKHCKQNIEKHLVLWISFRVFFRLACIDFVPWYYKLFQHQCSRWNIKAQVWAEDHFMSFCKSNHRGHELTGPAGRFHRWRLWGRFGDGGQSSVGLRSSFCSLGYIRVCREHEPNNETSLKSKMSGCAGEAAYLPVSLARWWLHERHSSPLLLQFPV